MAKYHVNPNTGLTARCSAELRCPFGGEELHSTTEEGARAAYENYVTNDIDPATSNLASFSKKPREPQAKKALSARVEKLRDALIDNGPPIALTAGIVTAVAFSGVLMVNHSKQGYEPVDTEVVASQVHDTWQHKRVGKVVQTDRVKKTEITVKVPGREQAVTVERDGDAKPADGSTLELYRSPDGEYKVVKPGSLKEKTDDAMIGGAVGMGTGMATIGVSALLNALYPTRRSVWR